MEWTDIINGFYKAAASVFLFMNCRRLYKDKRVQGVSTLSTAFFMSMGYWNLYFYIANAHLFSFLTGILVVIMNTTWVAQIIYYTRKNKKEGTL